MLRMCVYMHSRFIENHPIRILEDGLLISEVILSQYGTHIVGLKLILFMTNLPKQRSYRKLRSSPS
jgi:hypothetical protein